MADTAVAITAGTGTNIDTRTESTNGNHRQVIVLGDPATNAGVAPVDATAGLKVDLGADNDITGTVTANAGTNLNTSALALEAGGNLAAIKAKTDNIPALGQALAAASVPVVLPAAQITTLTPPAAITGFATAANQLPDGHNVTVDNASIAVTGTFWQATQPVSGTVTAAQATAANLNMTEASAAAIKTAVETIDNAIAGSEMQVDVVGALPAGTNAIGKLAANSGVDIGDVTINNATIAVTQSGTWDEVGINDSGNSITVDNGGTFAVQAATTIADGAAVTLGAKADDKSPATDTTAVSVMSVLKQISASVQAPPSQAVTNAGTFAVQAAATLAAETSKVIGTINVAASQTIGVTQATAGNLNCTEASAAAIKTAVETIDNAISGSEMQVDVVGALPAGTNTIGAVKSVPSDIDINGSNANHADKYYTNAGAVTDGIVWSPAAGKRWHILTLYIQVSAATTVTLEDDLAGGDAARWKAELAANSGVVLTYDKEHPFCSGEDAADLIITTTAGNVYVQAVGYEV